MDGIEECNAVGDNLSTHQCSFFLFSQSFTNSPDRFVIAVDGEESWWFEDALIESANRVESSRAVGWIDDSNRGRRLRDAREQAGATAEGEEEEEKTRTVDGSGQSRRGITG